MNDGTFRGGAQAFKLDTLLKLSDVKGTDGKTTLLHFVVQEIVRSEGKRAVRLEKENKSSSDIKKDSRPENVSDETEEQYHDLGLQVVSHLSSELEDVKKAAVIDAESLTGTAAKLGHGLLKIKNFVSIANSIYQKFEKFRFSNFYIKIFVKITKTKKTKNAVCIHRNFQIFFLVLK